MKALTTKVIVGTGVAGVSGTAAFGVWYVNKPKDVKSKLVSEGLTLVGNSPKAWRAVFLTHKGDSEFMSFAGVSAGESDKSAGPKVLASCKKAINVSIGTEGYDSVLDKARKYCTTPEFKTVEVKVLFSDNEIASEDRDWKNLFTIHKGDATFIDRVKKANSDATFESSTRVDDAKEKVKNFCNALKMQNPSSQNISDYERYCLQTVSNIRVFYERQGYGMVGESGWGDKFDSIKTKDNDVFVAIKGDGAELNASSGKDAGGPKLRAWCEVEVTKEISNADQKTKDRCFS